MEKKRIEARNKDGKDYTTKYLERINVNCHLCGYNWSTISDAHMVTCPKCVRKTPRIKEGDLKE